MLTPQTNPYRQQVDLSGIWDFQFDPNNEGNSSAWQIEVPNTRPIAVPASWNEQFEDNRDYLSVAWYQTTFHVPWGWGDENCAIYLRFESVQYLANVWLNGSYLGNHEGGHLPFEFDVTGYVHEESNRLVVRVDGELAPDRVPPGNLPTKLKGEMQALFGEANFPAASFDFFPFCGIQRPVRLYVRPRTGIDDITVISDIRGNDGLLKVALKCSSHEILHTRLSIAGSDISGEFVLENGYRESTVTIPNAHFWSPKSPYLYELSVKLLRDGVVIDQYDLPVGIRTIAVQGHQLLLNGEAIYLRGFGRHEDFPVVGRGFTPAVTVKDYALMKWMGANSFRTTHYPYSETIMELADRLGFLVIDETPAVGLFFEHEGLERRLELCQQYITELITRDKNHPSVIMWSLANEPHSQQDLEVAKDFFTPLFDLARSLDSSRPLTMASYIGVQEPAFKFADVLCLNRYLGWYSHAGQLDEAIPIFSEELDSLYKQYQKPIIISEFGADAIPGHHAHPPEMFSEEYQAEFVERYIRLFRTKSYIVGEHIWNLCDFKTGQAVRRAGSLNFKGIFTRDRRPKLAAHRVRQLWENSEFS